MPPCGGQLWAGLFAYKQERNFGHICAKQQHKQHQADHWQGHGGYALKLGLGHAAGNEEVHAHRRRNKADCKVDDHDHAKMQRRNANADNNRQKYRGQNDDGGQSLHECAHDKQEHVDQQKHHDLAFRDTYTSGGAYINFAAAVEMVLRNGRMKKYGDQILGVETGDPREFKTWEEFWNAYVKQHELFLKTAFTQQYLINKLRAEHFAQPMGSAMHDLCMKYCIDLHQEQIPEGINLGYFEYMGLGTVVDSLSAIKKFVFEEKKLTMDQLIKAIDANFEGYEDVQALLRSAPCYGNNDEYADSIGREIDRISVEYGGKYSMRDLGIHNDVRYVPFTSHVPFGKVVSATPNGRTEGFPLSDGSSASHGADVNGPTAVLLSNYNTKNMGMRDRAARMLNIKFTPKCLEGEAGTEKLVSFIRTFCDLKLWHVQFNVLNKETLIAAQKDPEKYRNLIVRIAGYSAYFVDLSPDLQNDLIARTEHESC